MAPPPPPALTAAGPCTATARPDTTHPARRRKATWSGEATTPSRTTPSGVNALWCHEHGGAALVRHHRVVGIPVIVGPASGGEHRPQKQPQALGVHAGHGIAGAAELHRALGGRPPP